jgi:AcrR family transcriptional regulator
MKPHKDQSSSPNQTFATSSTPQRILKAALKEFATYGLGGARMERIARKAGVNKALLFYYFSSKENLFQQLLTEAMNIVIPQLQQVILQARQPSDLIEVLPRIYTRFVLEHPDYIRMILLELIRNPQTVASLMSQVISTYQPSPPQEINKKIIAWGKKGLLQETDPSQLVLNLIPPMIFTPIIAPLVEILLQKKIMDSPGFLQRRITSLTQFLKKGVLP